MANSSITQIQVAQSAVTGKLFWGVAGTTLPTDATTALHANFKNLGYINEDGVQPAREVSVDPVNNDNGAKLLDVQTGFSQDHSATLLQVANEDLNNMIFGDANVTPTAGAPTFGQRLAVIDKGIVSDRGVLVIEARFNGTLGKKRRVIPLAQVTSMEEGPWVGTAVQQYTITWASSPDASGNYSYTYEDDGVLVP